MAARASDKKKRTVVAIPSELIRKPRSSRPAPAELPETISWWEEFYRVVRRIPRGRVCTYGAVAAMAGRPRAARHVGYALGALKETGKHANVPWQRVLGSRSRNRAGISIKDPTGGAVQRMLLEAEGVKFDPNGSVSLDRFGWFASAEARSPKKAPAAKPKRASAAKKNTAFAGARR